MAFHKKVFYGPLCLMHSMAPLSEDLCTLKILLLPAGHKRRSYWLNDFINKPSYNRRLVNKQIKREKIIPFFCQPAAHFCLPCSTSTPFAITVYSLGLISLPYFIAYAFVNSAPKYKIIEE